MKRLCLFILVCGFILPLVHAGDYLHKNAGQQAAVSQANQFCSPGVKYPPTKLEIIGNHCLNAAGNSYRVQGGLAFLSAADFRLSNNYHSFANNIADKDNLSFKEYLSHIYPSHNFW